jgi:uncharacterized protein (DUF2236 family)
MDSCRHFLYNFSTMSSGHPEHLNIGPVVPMPDGFPFTADSPLRKYAEPAGVFLVPYIAGMTILKDEVAAGVQQHSEFTTRPVARLIGTSQSALTLVFGNEEEAVGEATRIYQFHRDVVHGSVNGVKYEANDADLQAWVLACVTKGIEKVNERWTRRGAIDREGLWQDVRTFGTFFGIQPNLMPADIDELDAYWKEQVLGHSILQSGISRQMAHTTFRFTGGHVPKPLVRVGQAIWITSLDEKLQERANLVPNYTDKRIAHAVDAMMHHTYARIPDRRREDVIPMYMSAARRIRPLRRRLQSLKA